MFDGMAAQATWFVWGVEHTPNDKGPAASMLKALSCLPDVQNKGPTRPPKK